MRRKNMCRILTAPQWMALRFAPVTPSAAADAIPAILPLQATVLMGEGADHLLNEGKCVAVPYRRRSAQGY